MAAGVPTDLRDGVARLGRVFGEVDLAAHGLQPLLELLDELRQSIQVGQSSLLEVGAPFSEVEALESLVALGSQPGHGVDQGSLQVRVGELFVDPARKVASTFSHGKSALYPANSEAKPCRVPRELTVKPPSSRGSFAGTPECAPSAQARAVEASFNASTTALAVDTGAKHMVPTHTTARSSPFGSITAY